MKTQNRTAILALAAAGMLWGLTVPLSKLSLAWLGPGWLTVARFAVSAPLLALAGRRGLRDALVPRVATSGAIGFGAVILLQNAGIQHTSVSHAAVLVGVVPVLVALLAASLGHAAARPLAWGGYAIALAGIALVAGTSGAGATAHGDLLVLASAVLSAGLIVIQPQLLAGRDAAAITAVQFAAAALVAVPIAGFAEGAPPAPATTAPVLALAALSLAGTLLPFWLFAFGQTRVPAQLASVYLNLEPVVGAMVGWLAFGDTAAIGQLGGALAVLAGIALSTFPPRRAKREQSRARDLRRSPGTPGASTKRRDRLQPQLRSADHPDPQRSRQPSAQTDRSTTSDRRSGRQHRRGRTRRSELATAPTSCTERPASRSRQRPREPAPRRTPGDSVVRSEKEIVIASTRGLGRISGVGVAPSLAACRSSSPRSRDAMPGAEWLGDEPFCGVERGLVAPVSSGRVGQLPVGQKRSKHRAARSVRSRHGDRRSPGQRFRSRRAPLSTRRSGNCWIHEPGARRAGRGRTTIRFSFGLAEFESTVETTWTRRRQRSK